VTNKFLSAVPGTTNCLAPQTERNVYYPEHAYLAKKEGWIWEKRMTDR